MNNQPSETEIIAQFKKKRTRQILVAAILIISMVLIFYINENPNFTIAGITSLYLVYGMTVLLVLALIFTIYNWRCPACGKYLGRGMGPKSCPKCGAKLQ